MMKDGIISLYIPIGFPQEFELLSPIIEQCKRSQNIILFYDLISENTKAMTDRLQKIGLAPKTFSQFIMQSGYKAMFTAADLQPHPTYYMILEAKKLNIPTFGLQHGTYPISIKNIRDYYRPLCEWTFYWSETTKKVFVQRFNLEPGKTIAVGNPRIMYIKELLQSHGHEKQIYDFVLLLSDHSQMIDPEGFFKITQEEMQAIIKHICSGIAKSLPKSLGIIRKHPTDITGYENLYIKFLHDEGIDINIQKTGSLEEAILASKLGIAFNSSTFIDCVALERPVLFLTANKLKFSSENYPEDICLKIVCISNETSVDRVTDALNDLRNVDVQYITKSKIVEIFWGNVSDPCEKIVKLIEQNTINEFNKTIVCLDNVVDIHKKPYPDATLTPVIKDLIEPLDGKSIDMNDNLYDLKWTGERYLPDMDLNVSGVEIHYEHLHRYAYASRLVKSKKVLDLACGEGYGSFLLSNEASHVTGIDIDPQAIGHACRKYPKNNIDFIKGSILNIPIREEKIFDAIVCFEAIEHVEEHDKLMSEIIRLLKDDGLLIVSTPNKKEYSDDADHKNPFHLKELYLNEFEYLLKSNFKNYLMFGQAIFPGSEIWPVEEENNSKCSEILIENGQEGFSFTRSDKVPRYYIALASNADLDEWKAKSYLTDISGAIINNAYKNAEIYRQMIAERDSNILRVEGQLGKMTNQADVLNRKLRDLESITKEHQRVIEEKDKHIHNIEQELVKVENTLDNYSKLNASQKAKLDDYSKLNASQSAKIQEMEDIIFTHKEVIAGKDKHIQNIEALLNENNKKLNDIYQSITWRTITGYQNLVNVFLPPSSRRGKAYGMSLKSIRIVANEGVGSLVKRFKSRDKKKTAPDSNKIKIKQPVIQEVVPSKSVIDKNISIVIPTKNAGPDFEFTLEKIKNQKGVKKAEIIIVDSGSTDSTKELAEKYGAGIYSIKPDEFNHGSTRNFGADKVSGDYILFMVQDAIPVSDHWLYDMVNVLENDAKIAAVTCRQLPRCDSDLFAGFSLWSHYRALDFTRDKITYLDGKLSDLSLLEKRKLAGIEDTCCLIRKDVFDNMKYKDLQYAEDLDLGLRLIEQKYRIAFLYSVGVIHSHNRSPLYFIKRTYVDNKILSGILSYDPQPANTRDVKEAVGSVLALYAALNATLSTLDPSLFDGKIDHLFTALKSSMQENLKVNKRELESYIKGYGPLDNIFDELKASTGENISLKPDDLIDQHYFNLMDDFQRYLKSYKSLNGKKPELAESLYKLFSITAGSILADYYLNASSRGENSIELSQLDKILSAGI